MAAEVVVVYVHGVVDSSEKEVWYRVELPMTTNGKQSSSSSSSSHRKRKRDHHHHHSGFYRPVGEICASTGGLGGRWAVIGDEIYRVGAFYQSNLLSPRELSEKLFKHNIHCKDPTCWEAVPSSMNILRRYPFVVSIDDATTQKLCVVSGKTYRSDAGTYNSSTWTQCGETYNIKKDRWDPIDSDYSDISSYSPFKQISQDIDKPTQIVFYSLNGYMRVLDIAANKSNLGPTLYPAGFNMWRRSFSRLPKGLNINSENQYGLLKFITNNEIAVLADGTFYWCTGDDIHLYGYDTKEEKWLCSPNLDYHFPKLCSNPILLGLGNGKFVLVLAMEYGHSVMAIITVYKREYSLDVSVDPYHHVYYHESPFVPSNGKAMLKSTGSGSMH